MPGIRKDVALQASTVAIDNARTLNDERYHEALFARFARWAESPAPPPPGGPTFPPHSPELDDDDGTLGRLSARKAADAIVELQRRVYKDDAAPSLVLPSDATLADDPLVALLRARAQSGRLVAMSEDAPSQKSSASEPAAELSPAGERALEAIDEALRKGRTLEG